MDKSTETLVTFVTIGYMFEMSGTSVEKMVL